MSEIKIIALDLDGTLLNSNLELTPGNLAALEKAAAAGTEIVPTTGRFYFAMPAAIRSLPFINYAITSNGAAVYDVNRQQDIAKAEIPVSRAIEIMEHLDTLPIIYDCYMDNGAWMTRGQWERAEEFVPNKHYLKMVKDLRTPVPELKAHLQKTGHNVQKIQLLIKDSALRLELLDTLQARFPDTIVSSSVPNNIEINDIHANKGEALKKLAVSLGCSIEQTMSFGDGLNDLSMIKAAGIGVAMGNACPEVLSAANALTLDHNHDGVAAGILKYCFGVDDGSF